MIGTSAKLLPNYRLVLVAFDGSMNSQRALSRAATLAKANGATLKVVVVMPPSPYEEDVKRGNDLLESAVSMAKNTLRDVEGVLRDGQPADEVLKLAEEESADVVVVGRRGISGIERFLLGGVSSAVVNHSKCDVLVVK